MVDSHVDGERRAAAKNRSKAESAPGPSEPVVKAGPRSFAKAAADAEHAASHTASHAAGDARAAAKAGVQAGKDLASAGQDAMRKASGQAADLWRASLDPLSNLQAEFGRWFDQTWRQGVTSRLLSAPPFGQSMLATLSGSPHADLFETETQAELVVEIPGLSAKDVHLALKGDILTVSGDRSEEITREDGAYRLHERRTGHFERSFSLPHGVDPSRIEARFDKGVLSVTMPRSGQPEAESRRIPIKG